MATINNEVIGPVIEAEIGDTVRVTTTNKMHDGTAISIHYHGITQKDTPYADGAGTVACSVAMGETRVDEWIADHAGTFWYHSHVRLLGATVALGNFFLSSVFRSHVQSYLLDCLLSVWTSGMCLVLAFYPRGQ